MDEVVIVAAARTAVGKFGGAIAKVPAAELGAHVIKGLVAQTGIDPQQISEVILGQVLTAGVGQNPARQAVIKAGLPDQARRAYDGVSFGCKEAEEFFADLGSFHGSQFDSIRGDGHSRRQTLHYTC